MAGMQFCNAVLPVVYYAVKSNSGRRNYYEDDDDFVIVGDGDGKRRGSKMGAWRLIAILHTMVWGSGFFLFLLSFIG